MYVGFEKMEHGLSEKFTDKTSPIKNHTDTLVDLGADPKPLHRMNTVTSDVIKVLCMSVHIQCSIQCIVILMAMLTTTYAYTRRSGKFWC